MNRLCAWLLTAALLTGIFNTGVAVSAKADTADIPAATTTGIVASGTCGGEGDGTNLTWVLDADGVLTVNGTGAMMEWDSAYGMPWSSYVNSIKTVVIGDSVTTIGKWAFNGCLYLSQ